MGNEITLIGDGDGLAVIGPAAEVERFLLDQGLDRAPSKALDLHRLSSLTGTGDLPVAGVQAQHGRFGHSLERVLDHLHGVSTLI